MNKAVLFVTFNRSDTAMRVFERIREAKPPRLYLASDGARENVEGEWDKVNSLRQLLLDNIDWECKVKTRFLEKNSGGCAYGVSGAVSWFFENENDGIILEDDCLPSKSFFNYCEELLDKYKNEKKVWHITGFGNYQDLNKKETYYFSKIQHCWGWASWADRWQYYQFDLSNYGKIDVTKFSKKKYIQKAMEEKVQIVQQKGFSDCWAWQWAFIIVQNNGYCINPYRNLISNIGAQGEHYKGEKDDSLFMPTFEISKIVHPKKIKYNEKAINYIYENHYKIKKDNSFVKTIVSLKNIDRHVVLNIFGIRMKFKIRSL